MAFFEQSRAPFGAITVHSIVMAVSNLVESFRTWQIQRRTYGELASLSPEQLEDIGLTKADLEDMFLIR